MCTQKGCSLSHGVPKLTECRPGLLEAILPPQGNRIPNNEANREEAGCKNGYREIPEDIIYMSEPAMPEAAYLLDLSATSANEVFFWPTSIWVKIL